MRHIRRITAVMMFAALACLYTACSFRKPAVPPQAESNISNEYKVICDSKLFYNGRMDYLYEPGDQVLLVFSGSSKDKDYTFRSEQAGEIKADYYPGSGYLIRFQMPDENVTVEYETTAFTENAQQQDSRIPSDEIHIAKDENPTTGFEWEYTVEQEGMLVLVENHYVSDQSDEPVDGLGGTRFWKFRILGEGRADIRFQEQRGSEENGWAAVYSYDCTDTGAVLEGISEIDLYEELE